MLQLGQTHVSGTACFSYITDLIRGLLAQTSNLKFLAFSPFVSRLEPSTGSLTTQADMPPLMVGKEKRDGTDISLMSSPFEPQSDFYIIPHRVFMTFFSSLVLGGRDGGGEGRSEELNLQCKTMAEPRNGLTRRYASELILIMESPYDVSTREIMLPNHEIRFV